MGDVEATVHWHGLRLENRYDGVPHETQAPIPIGGTFTCKVQFPDAGLYWYHRWWPPFCLVVDWLAAAILVFLIAAGVHFHP